MDSLALSNVLKTSKNSTGGWAYAAGGNTTTISVVIPTRNEARNLPFVLPKIPEWVDEIILVDGHSTDNTVAVARELLPRIRVITQPGRGKGEALRCGLEAATGDIVVLIDADGSNDPGEIHAFASALLSGADFAKGTRFTQGGGSSDITALRSLGHRGLTMLVRLLFGGAYTDLCYGYNAFWRDLISVLGLECDGFEIETEMNIRALRRRLRICEVPSYEYSRINGASNLKTFPDGWRVLKTILRELRSKWSERMGERPGVKGPQNLSMEAFSLNTFQRQAEPLLIPVTSNQPASGVAQSPCIGD